jgi:mannose-1-phosphate guanylyltransferase/mannose-1-phosphate guanylyltransferase/phosphomannomutase
MVPVLNRPVMEHIVRHLARQGFTETIANLHWFPDLIEGHFGDGSRFGVDLTYSREEALLGTAGGVRNAADFLGDSFLIISGDALTDIDLATMRDFHQSHDGVATLATRRVAETDQFGVVITGDDARIQGFQEKPDPSEALSDLANCGIYMFDAEIFDYFPPPGGSKLAGPEDPDGFADWAMDVFPALLEGDVPFYSHEVDAYWNDIGNLTELTQGNFDALTGAVGVDPGAPEVSDGVFASSRLDGVEIEGPVLVGERVEIGEGTRIEGPVVIGDGCTIGDGALLRESVLLDGSVVAANSMLVGGISGAITAKP